MTIEKTSDQFTVTIDGRSSTFVPGTTVLEAARSMGIAIPTLCSYKGLSPYGACRVCIVEMDTPRGPKKIASCSYPIENNMQVRTDTAAIRESRKVIIELLLAQAPDSTELAAFAKQYDVATTPFDKSKDGKCILCGLCVRTCNEVMGRGAISVFGRGYKREVRPAYNEVSSDCQICGACEKVCPTGAVNLKLIAPQPAKPHATAYNQYLEARPNIDLAHPQAVPRVPSIDRESCIHFKTGECGYGWFG